MNSGRCMHSPFLRKNAGLHSSQLAPKAEEWHLQVPVEGMQEPIPPQGSFIASRPPSVGHGHTCNLGQSSSHVSPVSPASQTCRGCYRQHQHHQAEMLATRWAPHNVQQTESPSSNRRGNKPSKVALKCCNLCKSYYNLVYFGEGESIWVHVWWFLSPTWLPHTGARATSCTARSPGMLLPEDTAVASDVETVSRLMLIAPINFSSTDGGSKEKCRLTGSARRRLRTRQTASTTVQLVLSGTHL